MSASLAHHQQQAQEADPTSDQAQTQTQAQEPAPFVEPQPPPPNNVMSIDPQHKLRVGLSITAASLLIASIVMLFLVLLAGSDNSSPLNSVYYLQVDISSNQFISPDHALRWTTWNICGVENGKSVHCDKKKAAHAFNPAKQVPDATPPLPASIIDHSAEAATATRTLFAFLILSLATAFVTLAIAPGGCLGRWGCVFGFFASVILVFFIGIASIIATVTFSNARDRFNAHHIDAKLGTKLFAFLWTSFSFSVLTVVAFAFAAGRNPAAAK